MKSILCHSFILIETLITKKYYLIVQLKFFVSTASKLRFNKFLILFFHFFLVNTKLYIKKKKANTVTIMLGFSVMRVKYYFKQQMWTLGNSNIKE